MPSSLLTPKEKEVVNDFIKKAETQGRSAGYNEYMHSWEESCDRKVYAIGKYNRFPLEKQVCCSRNLPGNKSNNRVTFNHRYGVRIVRVVVFFAAL